MVRTLMFKKIAFSLALALGLVTTAAVVASPLTALAQSAPDNGSQVQSQDNAQAQPAQGGAQSDYGNGWGGGMMRGGWDTGRGTGWYGRGGYGYGYPMMGRSTSAFSLAFTALRLVVGVVTLGLVWTVLILLIVALVRHLRKKQ